MFNEVLHIMGQVTGDMECITIGDWNLLSTLPSPHSVTDVRKIFYPNATIDDLVNIEAPDSSFRRPGFIAQVSDTEYRDIYEAVFRYHDLEFPDIQKILRGSRAQGKAISQVINHVVQWINPSPKSGDRTQLRQEFLPAFQNGGDTKARKLQRRIFDIVRDRMAELTDGSACLSKLPNDVGSAYLERFKLPIWRDILVEVHNAIGANFQGPLVQFNTQDPLNLQVQQESTLVQAIQDAISKIPQVARNPALRTTKALESLIKEISPAITSWAKNESDEAMHAQAIRLSSPWPSSVREFVASQRSELGETSSKSSEETSSLPVQVNSESHRREEDENGSEVEKLRDQTVGADNESAHPQAGFNFLDIPSDLTEGKRRHRERHAARPADEKKHHQHRNDREVAPAKINDPRSSSQPTQSTKPTKTTKLRMEPRHNVAFQSSKPVLPPKQTTPLWMDSVLAQRRRKR
jgi:hypothetical protein